MLKVDFNSSSHVHVAIHSFVVLVSATDEHQCCMRDTNICVDPALVIEALQCLLYPMATSCHACMVHGKKVGGTIEYKVLSPDSLTCMSICMQLIAR